MIRDSTSGIEMELLREGNVFPYLVDVDWDMGKGEYGRSDSLTGWTLAANKELCKEFA